jgi:putative endonuclease
MRGAVSFDSGVHAERLASAALERDGFEILACRRRTPFGEIDIIASNEDLLCFVEVKHRPTLADAAVALTPRQARRLYQAADFLLQTETTWARSAIRFDLIVVDRSGDMRRVKDVLRADQV